MEMINDRIATLIHESKKTKTWWANQLNVTPQFVSSLCNGRKAPSDRTIADICRVFSVNETWLRTGDGKMFVPTKRDDEIAAFVGQVMAGEEDSFKRRFVAMLARLDESEWELIEQKALELFKGKKKD